jgi:hypothetical protein
MFPTTHLFRASALPAAMLVLAALSSAPAGAAIPAASTATKAFSSAAGAPAFAAAPASNAAANPTPTAAIQAVPAPPAPAPAKPSTRIFNGSKISIAQAPWNVFLEGSDGTMAGDCGGSIISPTQVVTAAHCVADWKKYIGHDPGTPATPGFPQDSGFYIVAGDSVIPTEAVPAGANEKPQYRFVTSARIHPQWGISPVLAAGDVAILTLNKALDFSTPNVQPIALPPSVGPVDGEPIAVGPAVHVVGYGQQAVGKVDNNLYAEDETVIDPDNCSALAPTAVSICSSTPTGTTCHGDSGGGLVTMLPTPVLVGVVSGGPSAGCAVGEPTTYTNLTAPENRQFVAGNDTPPIAPRQATPATGSSADLHTGTPVICGGATFTNGATVKWKVSNETGAVLAAGFGATFSYIPVDGDIGHKLGCRAYASNAGGVAVSEQLRFSAPITAGAPKELAVYASHPKTVRRGHKYRFTITLANLAPTVVESDAWIRRIHGKGKHKYDYKYVVVGDYERAHESSLRVLVKVPGNAKLGKHKYNITVATYDAANKMVQSSYGYVRVKIKR